MLLSTVMTALAAIVFLSPGNPAVRRLPQMMGAGRAGSSSEDPHSRVRRVTHRRRLFGCAVVPGIALAFYASPYCSIAWFIVLGFLARALGMRGHCASRVASNRSWSRAVAAIAAEVRSGTHLGAAARNVSAALPPGRPRRFLATVSATERLGGGVTKVGSTSDCLPEMALGQVWSMAHRYGIPPANLLDELRVGMASRAERSDRVAASLAGPRATAAILGGLPILGIICGELIGAHPLAVLAHSQRGGIAAIAGSLLLGFGLVWSEHIIGRAQL